MRCNLKIKSDFKLKGLTLVELIVVVAIVAISLAQFIPFLFRTSKLHRRTLT